MRVRFLYMWLSKGVSSKSNFWVAVLKSIRKGRNVRYGKDVLKWVVEGT